MTRKEFREDLHDAAASNRYQHLSRIKPGENDGSISFCFTVPASNERIHLEAIVSGEYLASLILSLAHQ